MTFFHLFKVKFIYDIFSVVVFFDGYIKNPFLCNYDTKDVVEVHVHYNPYRYHKPFFYILHFLEKLIDLSINSFNFK